MVPYKQQFDGDRSAGKLSARRCHCGGTERRSPMEELETRVVERFVTSPCGDAGRQASSRYRRVAVKVLANRTGRVTEGT